MESNMFRQGPIGGGGGGPFALSQDHPDDRIVRVNCRSGSFVESAHCYFCEVQWTAVCEGNWWTRWGSRYSAGGSGLTTLLRRSLVEPEPSSTSWKSELARVECSVGADRVAVHIHLLSQVGTFLSAFGGGRERSLTRSAWIT